MPEDHGFPTLGELRVEEIAKPPPIPVAQEVHRAFKEDEMEDLLEQQAREEGRLIIRMMENVVGDKGRLNLAHQLFVYGLPEGPRRGIPIRNVAKLARVCGLHRKVLEPHVRPWTREAMRIARDSSPIYAFACSKEARETHLKDLETMRVNIGKIEEAITSSAVGSRQWIELHRLLKEARKEWQDASGVTSGVKISEEAAKLQAKALIDSMKEENSDKPGREPVRRIGGKCFDVD